MKCFSRQWHKRQKQSKEENSMEQHGHLLNSFWNFHIKHKKKIAKIYIKDFLSIFFVVAKVHQKAWSKEALKILLEEWKSDFFCGKVVKGKKLQFSLSSMELQWWEKVFDKWLCRVFVWEDHIGVIPAYTIEYLLKIPHIMRVSI